MDFDPSSYEPPLSLWSLIQQHIADSEQFEVKKSLGVGLVDQSHELRQEINTYLEIYQDMREQEDNEQRLPQSLDSTESRERLKTEILFFLEGIREQANNHGRDVNRSLKGHNMEVIDYAYESGSSRPSSSDCSRPSTASIRVTPLSSSRKPHKVDVSAMKDKLNYLSFDDVRFNLQQHLQAEVNQLMEDLENIQNGLYQVDTARSESRLSVREPTISELTEERKRLEKTFLEGSHTVVNALPDRPSRPSTASRNIPPLPRVHRPAWATPPCGSPSLRDSPTPLQFNRPIPPVTPPSSAPRRPSSVHRLRRIVLENRQQMQSTDTSSGRAWSP